jgi:hypothetical protein
MSVEIGNQERSASIRGPNQCGEHQKEVRLQFYMHLHGLGLSWEQISRITLTTFEQAIYSFGWQWYVLADVCREGVGGGVICGSGNVTSSIGEMRSGLAVFLGVSSFLERTGRVVRRR